MQRRFDVLRVAKHLSFVSAPADAGDGIFRQDRAAEGFLRGARHPQGARLQQRDLRPLGVGVEFTKHHAVVEKRANDVGRFTRVPAQQLQKAGGIAFLVEPLQPILQRYEFVQQAFEARL